MSEDYLWYFLFHFGKLSLFEWFNCHAFIKGCALSSCCCLHWEKAVANFSFHERLKRVERSVTLMVPVTTCIGSIMKRVYMKAWLNMKSGVKKLRKVPSLRFCFSTVVNKNYPICSALESCNYSFSKCFLRLQFWKKPTTFQTLTML